MQGLYKEHLAKKEKLKILNNNSKFGFKTKFKCKAYNGTIYIKPKY